MGYENIYGDSNLKVGGRWATILPEVLRMKTLPNGEDFFW